MRSNENKDQYMNAVQEARDRYWSGMGFLEGKHALVSILFAVAENIVPCSLLSDSLFVEGIKSLLLISPKLLKPLFQAHDRCRHRLGTLIFYVWVSTSNLQVCKPTKLELDWTGSQDRYRNEHFSIFALYLKNI